MSDFFSINLFDKSPKTLALTASQDIKSLHKLFSSEHFKTCNPQELHMYFKERMVTLDLSDDYVTAYIALKANPQAACLFSKEIQEKFSLRASIFADIPFEEDQETVVLTPPLSQSPAMSSCSELSDDASLSVLSFEEFVAQSPLNSTSASIIAPTEDSEDERALSSPSSPIITSAKTSMAASTVINPQHTALIELYKTCQEAKSACIHMMIEESFPADEKPIIQQILKHPDPVLAIMLDQAKDATDGHHKTWVKTISLHIKSSASYQSASFEQHAAKLEMAFLTFFDDEEQEAALEILAYPRAIELVNKLTLASLPTHKKLQTLEHYLKPDILKRALYNYLGTIHLDGQDFRKTLQTSPSETIKSQIETYLSSSKSGRSTLRLIIGLELARQNRKQTPSRDPHVEAMVKTAKREKNPLFLDFLNNTQKALVTEQEKQEIHDAYALSVAEKSLAEDNKILFLNLTSKHISSLPEALKRELLEKGFDLSGDDDL